MKLRCPRCEKKLNIPEKFAGKAIRCPACQRAFRVPELDTGMGGGDGVSQLDLEGLAQLETSSSEMAANELAAAQAAVDAKKAAEPLDKSIRVCPKCNNRVKTEDPYAEVLCSSCWHPIPPMLRGSGRKRARTTAGRGTGKGGFYTELGASVAYPFPALSSLLTAAGVAVAVGLIPVAVITALSNLMEQGAVGTEEGVKAANLSGVALLLIGIFGAEVMFFSAVALHAFLDVVRTTSVNNDKPPSLSWGPSQWGKSALAYILLLVYCAVAFYVVSLITIDDDVLGYIKSGQVKEIPAVGGTGFIVGLVVVSFGIPMNLLGISLGSIAQGLNPANVVKSIGRTHIHYVFLVLLLSMYGILFGGAFAAILFDWFVPQLETMYESSAEGDVMQVALALGAWGLVMGFFFYGTYVLARLHGLFARTFRKDLAFGTH